MGISEITNLIFNEAYNDALIEIEQLSDEDILEGQILKSYIYHCRGAYNSSLTNLDEVLQTSSLPLNLQFMGLVIKAYSLFLMSNREQVNIQITVAEKVLEKIPETERVKILIWEGIMYHVKTSQAINEHEDIILAEKYSNQSINLKIKAGFEKSTFSTVNNLCIYYIYLGEIQKAQKSLDQLHNILNKHYDSSDPSNALYHILSGLIYHVRGELENALDNFEQGLDISSNLSIPFYQALAGEFHHFISKIFYDQDDYQNSLKSSINALTIQENEPNLLYLSRTLFQLVLITLKMNRLPQANKYLAKLELTVNKSDQILRPIISSYHELSKAMILIKDERTYSRVEAQKLFQKLAQEHKLEYQIVILAHLNQCELLIEELKQFENPSILEEIEDLLGKIMEISERADSHSLIGEILLLQAQIKFFQLKLEETNVLLEKALTLSKEKGLTRLESRVLEARSAIQNHVKTSVQVAKQAPELLERLEKSQLIEYIVEMKKMVELMKASE